MTLLDSFMEWCFDHGAVGFIAMMVGLLALAGAAVGVIAAPFAIYDAMQPTFTLRKDQWGCTANHTELISGGYFAGKVWMPTTTPETVCDQWSRR